MILIISRLCFGLSCGIELVISVILFCCVLGGIASNIIIMVRDDFIYGIVIYVAWLVQ